MRFVDTENEGLNGWKYGDRLSLTQQRASNQDNLYRVMNGEGFDPSVQASFESVAGALP
jgi:hypothetical protein